MPHRNNLTSLKLGYGLRDFFNKEGRYTQTHFSKDFIAGLTVGILTIPISMALATGIGVSPIYGLFTAIVAGVVTALAGGSRYSIAGPTASFVILLIPVTDDFGLFGVLMVSLLSGIILVLMALLRFGRWIEYIPEALIFGFTSGIAILIILLQMKDFFGLPIIDLPTDFIERLFSMAQSMGDWHWESTALGFATLLFMIAWSRLPIKFPGHLPGLILASLATFYWNQQGAAILTVGDIFDDIPHFLPSLQTELIVTNLTSISVQALWDMLQELLPIAITLAILIALESLFCAIVLDNLSAKRHSPNSELMGQGLGNVFAPLLGGFASSGAIARSVTNLRAGAVSPIAGVVHALVVLVAIYFFANMLMYMPMPAMSAILVLTAWNMSNIPRAVQLIKNPNNNDAWIYFTSVTMMLFFDLVVAVTMGMVLASILFIKEIAEMTKLQDIHQSKRYHSELIPDNWNFYRIQGPLFFAAADRIFGELSNTLHDKKGIVIQMDAVTIIDSGGLSALRRFVTNAEKYGVEVYLSELQFQPLKTLARYGLDNFGEHFKLFSLLDDAQAEASTSATRKR